MNLFFENMKWLRGSSSSGRGVDEKVVVEVMTILMIVMMILIMIVILIYSDDNSDDSDDDGEPAKPCLQSDAESPS